MQHQSPKSTHFSLITLLVVGSLGTMQLLSARAQADILQTEGRAIMADSTLPNTSARRLDIKNLSSDIDELIQSEPGARIGVQLHDFITGRTLSFGSDESFVAASVPKLLTASLWFHHVDEGKRSLNDIVGGSTAESQLKLLIEVSDNNAWELLDAKLGKKELESYARSIGMQSYDFDTNSLSPSDALILLQKLYTGNLLKSDSQKKLLAYMSRANYRQYIVTALPTSAEVYHKVGFLEDRVLDTAIVENKNLSYALVIFTEAKSGGFSLGSAGQAVRDITEVIQARYQ